MDPTIAALLPVGSLFVGIVGTLVVERLRDSRLERRETAARRLQREATLQERRDNFELENLTALMLSTDDLLRASFRHHFLDRSAANATNSKYGAYRTDNLPEGPEIGEAFRAANASVQSRLALVLDETLRDDFGVALIALNAIPLEVRTIEAADTAHSRAAAAVYEVQMKVAERIREIYLTGDTTEARPRVTRHR
jgi:hypothetical protein